MAVIVQQWHGDEVTDGPRPVYGEGTDAELLARKAAGASGKGWAVMWQGSQQFTATKRRHGDRKCIRKFWIE